MKYLPHFDKIRGSLNLVGNRILIELLPKDELKTAGGLIMAADLKGHRTQTSDARPQIAMVLALGTETTDPVTGELVAGSRYQVGNVLWITKHPIVISEFPGLGSTDNKIALITDDPSDVHAVWKDLEEYERFKQLSQTN